MASRRIVLAPPRIDGRAVTFAWRVEPATELYRATSFTLRLPAGMAAADVPERLWWTVALLCLHPHWPLLRPCRVELPVALDAAEIEFWHRLLAAEVATLEAHRGDDPSAAAALGIEIVVAGTEGQPAAPLALPAPLAESGRCAAAFSGGKDSLLQAALLCELTERPLLVATTSPMPPLHDHETPRRRQVLAAMAARRAVELVEVESDLRACWKNDFPPAVGFQVAVNELTDTFLYFAALLAVAFLRGATHLFLASEAELQESAEVGGRIVQHPHAMYSAATQRALSQLVAPLGFTYGSLNWPLPSGRVQELLWTRYPDLADLQYSCWRVGADEAACSRCSQCLRVAMGALAAGGNPERMGIDLVRLLPAMADWAPDAPDAAAAQGPDASPLLPRDVVRRDLHREAVRSISRVPPRRVAAAIARGGFGRLLSSDGRRALAAFRQLRRRLAASGRPGAPTYRAGFLPFIDPLLATRAAAIYEHHFAAEDPALHAGTVARSDALTCWIAAPLALS